MHYLATTMPLGDSVVTSTTVLFAPHWGPPPLPQDVLCFVGSANNLEPDLASVHGGGGADCTAANGCGVHVHAGTDCTDKDTQGGHWYDTEAIEIDPWALVGYESTDVLGYGQYASCVRTGLNLYPDPAVLVGHAFIVHSNDGSRVSCGLITAAPEGYAPTTLTAVTVPIPGAELPSEAPTGAVGVLTDLIGGVPDGVCYVGYAEGLEPDVESYLLGTGSQNCNATNGCGAHIHAGTGCEDKDAQGGHYYDETALLEDPWALESYYETDGEGRAVMYGCTITGRGASNYEKLPFIVHTTDGGRLLCGLLSSDGPDVDHPPSTPLLRKVAIKS